MQLSLNWSQKYLARGEFCDGNNWEQKYVARGEFCDGNNWNNG